MIYHKKLKSLNNPSPLLANLLATASKPEKQQHKFWVMISDFAIKKAFTVHLKAKKKKRSNFYLQLGVFFQTLWKCICLEIWAEKQSQRLSVHSGVSLCPVKRTAWPLSVQPTSFKTQPNKKALIGSIAFWRSSDIKSGFLLFCLIGKHHEWIHKAEEKKGTEDDCLGTEEDKCT